MSIGRLASRPAYSTATRRSIGSRISASTKRLATDFLNNATVTAPRIRKQYLDANQLQRLSLTLDRSDLYSDLPVAGENGAPRLGTPLPPGYHLAYFTPAAVSSDLGIDGTEKTYSPGGPFKRQMWAGGELKWNQSNPLRVGQEAVESTRVVGAVPRITRQGEEMIVVGIEKVLGNERGWAIVDHRDWVFKKKKQIDENKTGGIEEQQARSTLQDPHLDPGLPNSDPPTTGSSSTQSITKTHVQTPISLFRFSALTFNAHMIHYSRPWTRQHEGQPEIIVHGPLSLINMLDFWRDEVGSDRSRNNRSSASDISSTMNTTDYARKTKHIAQGYAIPKLLRYRALAPIYVDTPYRAVLDFRNEHVGTRSEESEDSDAVQQRANGESGGEVKRKACVRLWSTPYRAAHAGDDGVSAREQERVCMMGDFEY